MVDVGAVGSKPFARCVLLDDPAPITSLQQGNQGTGESLARLIYRLAATTVCETVARNLSKPSAALPI